MFFSFLCLLCLCARLFIRALWSPAVKGLTSWRSFVVSSCESVTFPLISWVRCGTSNLCTLTYLIVYLFGSELMVILLVQIRVNTRLLSFNLS